MCIHRFELGTKNLKFVNAQQGTHVYHIKGIKEGLYKAYASISIAALSIVILL